MDLRLLTLNLLFSLVTKPRSGFCYATKKKKKSYHMVLRQSPKKPKPKEVEIWSLKDGNLHLLEKNANFMIF